MTYANYKALKIRTDKSAMWVTIDHPPVNLLDLTLMIELNDLAGKVAGNAEIDVIVFQSADPDFFITHGDMNFANNPDEFSSLRLGDVGTEKLNPMMRLHERLRSLPQITIGKISGLARGGGAELLSALDMRFAAIGKAGLAQMEALVGIIPGAGGTVYLPSLVGYAKALEIIVGAELVSAEEAERCGWVNKAVPANDLDNYVGELVRKIVSRAPGAARSAKQAIKASFPDIRNALAINNQILNEVFSAPAAKILANDALSKGAQTREGEKNLENLLK